MVIITEEVPSLGFEFFRNIPSILSKPSLLRAIKIIHSYSVGLKPDPTPPY